MCDEDARDAEHDIHVSMAKGQCHEVTADVTVRVTLMVPGAFHDPFELEDLISETDLGEGEIMNVEEV